MCDAAQSNQKKQRVENKQTRLTEYSRSADFPPATIETDAAAVSEWFVKEFAKSVNLAFERPSSNLDLKTFCIAL